MTGEELYARLYDLRVPDWPGEVDFYRELLTATPVREYGVLEVACGTGRVSRQLALEGVAITGLDISPELLRVAHEKSVGMSNICWVQGDMRAFDLGRRYGLVIIPGHSFQFMTTPEDQVSCLECLKKHLSPDGLLVIHLDHQDFGWLGDLVRQKEPVFKAGDQVMDPASGRRYRFWQAWSFEPSSQAAIVRQRWQELGDGGEVIQAGEMLPKRLHCVFRFEMEHLLRRVGFSIDAVYGDFFKNELGDSSGQMIWLARRQGG